MGILHALDEWLVGKKAELYRRGDSHEKKVFGSDHRGCPDSISNYALGLEGSTDKKPAGRATNPGAGAGTK